MNQSSSIRSVVGILGVAFVIFIIIFLGLSWGDYSALGTRLAMAGIGGVILSGLYVFLRAKSVGAISQKMGNLIHSLVDADFDEQNLAVSPQISGELANALNRIAGGARNLLQTVSQDRNRLMNVLNTMEDGVILVDPDGNVELINEAAGTLVGLDLDTPHTGSIMGVIRDHELQQLVSHATDTRDQQSNQVELLQTRKFVNAIAIPLSVGDGEGVLLTLHDLTDIRQLDITRREFVSNVSHELRNPLAAVKAMVETLEGGALDDSSVSWDFLKRIDLEVDHMNRMVEELLELTRLESGQLELELQSVDIGALISSMIDSFDQQAFNKGVAIKSKIAGEIPQCLVDPRKIRQVLQNLIDNALKFTDEGDITVSAERSEFFLSVSVADSGIGIPSDDVPHIFERFYKVDRSRRSSGIGLGLAIVKHIVQAHGGAIHVESAEDNGSRFVFTLPLA